MFGPPRGASAGRRKAAAAVGSRSQGSRFVPTDAIAVFDDTYARHRPAPEAPLRAPTPAVRSVAVAASPSQCSIAVAARPRVAEASTQRGRRRREAQTQTDRPAPAAALRAEADTLRAKCAALEAALEELTATPRTAAAAARSPHARLGAAPGADKRCALLRFRLAQYERQVLRAGSEASEARVRSEDAHAAVAGLAEQLGSLDGAASLTAARCQSMREWCEATLRQMAQRERDRAAVCAAEAAGEMRSGSSGAWGAAAGGHEARQSWDARYLPAGGNRFLQRAHEAGAGAGVSDVASGAFALALASEGRADLAGVEDALCEAAPRLRRLAILMDAQLAPSLAPDVEEGARREVEGAARAVEEAADALAELTAVVPARGLLPAPASRRRNKGRAGAAAAQPPQPRADDADVRAVLAERDALRNALAAMREDAKANALHVAAYEEEVAELRASTQALAAKVLSGRGRAPGGAGGDKVAAEGDAQGTEDSASALEALLAAHAELLAAPTQDSMQRLVGAISLRGAALQSAACWLRSCAAKAAPA